MVSVPPSMASGGERIRRYFPDKPKAAKFAGEQRAAWAKGLRAGLLQTNVAMEVREALKILEPTGFSIIEAARMVARQVQESGTSQTLQERFAEYCRKMEPHWRPRYAADMSYLPRWVGPELMATRVSEITPARLLAALKAHGARTEGTLKMRGDRVRAAIANVGKKSRRMNVQIMTLTQCGRMLRATCTPAERRAVALLLFAGIRPGSEDGEITRLDWSAVGEEQIYIAAEVSKTGSDRHIPLTPRLARLLRGHPADGPVRPPGWKLRWQRIRRAAGVVQSDITRHTFASHFLAAYGELKAKSAMGHSAVSTTLMRHYRRAVLEADGLKYFR
jgi:integrase